MAYFPFFRYLEDRDDNIQIFQIFRNILDFQKNFKFSEKFLIFGKVSNFLIFRNILDVQKKSDFRKNIIFSEKILDFQIIFNFLKNFRFLEKFMISSILGLG